MDYGSVHVIYPVPGSALSAEGRRLWERALPGLVRDYYETLRVCAGGKRDVVGDQRWHHTAALGAVSSHGGAICENGATGEGYVLRIQGVSGDGKEAVGCGDGAVSDVGSGSGLARDMQARLAVCSDDSYGGSHYIEVPGRGVDVSALDTAADRSGMACELGASNGGGDSDALKVGVVAGRAVPGPNVVANREKRRKAKARRERKRQNVGGGAGVEEREACRMEDKELRNSLRDKWLAENALAVAKAQKSLAVVKARDVDQQAKAERARALRRTETDLVAVERAHGQLRATGNVPGVPGLSAAGTVETVVSSGSISPNSSASLADLHKSLKRVSDLESMLLRNGLDPFADGKPKDLWTIGSDGELVCKEAADEFYGDYAMLPLEIDGKKVAQIVTGF